MGGGSECQKNGQGGSPRIVPSRYRPGGHILGVWGWGALVLGHSRGCEVGGVRHLTPRRSVEVGGPARVGVG